MTDYQSTSNLVATLARQKIAGMQAGGESDFIKRARIATSGAEKQSVLGVLDRARYGFADDWGKRQIIQQAGYDPRPVALGGQLVSLQNGEYGVKTAQGIKPIDPKGFQFSDITSDIAESVGKGIPTVFGILGTGAGLGMGSVAGASIGTTAGEIARQGIGEMIGVRQRGISNEDFKEMATEGLLGGTGQGLSLLAGKSLQGIMRAGSTKGGAVAGDVIGTTKASNVLSDMLGTGKSNTKIITKGFNENLPIVRDLGELAEQTDAQLIDLIETKNKTLYKQFLEPELQRVAQLQGIQNVDDVVLDMDTTKRTLNKLIKDTTKSRTLVKSQKDAIKTQIAEFRDLVRENPQITYGQFKEQADNIFKLGKVAYDKGDYAGYKNYKKIYESFVGSRAEQLSPEAFKLYSQQRKSLSKMDDLFRINLSEGGELRPGGVPLIGKLTKFSDEIKQATNYNKLQSILKEAGDAGVEGVGQVNNSIDTFLFNHALSKAQHKPGVIGKIIGSTPLKGLGEVITEPLTDPINKAKLIKGMFNMGILDKTQLDNRVSETVLPRLNTVANLLNAKRLIDSGVPVNKVSKLVPKSIRKPIQKIAQRMRPGLPGGIAARSLNNILYGEQ